MSKLLDTVEEHASLSQQGGARAWGGERWQPAPCKWASRWLCKIIDFWPDTRAVSPLHDSGARSDSLPNIDEQGFKAAFSRACAHVHLDLQRTTR